MIEAGSLRNKKVFTSNKKVVGIVQNVLFEGDPVNPTAYVLVFLTEKNWLRKYLEENWGRIGIETLTTLLPGEESKIIQDVKEKGEKEAKKFWTAYLKDNADKAENSLKKCYLFPSSQIDEPACNDKQVKLKTEQDDVEDFGVIGIPILVKNSKKMFALYETSNLPVRDQASMLPVTLNKTPIHLKTISDATHQKGLISDIQLDTSKGQVANFIIDVSGDNAGKRIVPLMDINFDTQVMKKNRLFKTYPLLQH